MNTPRFLLPVLLCLPLHAEPAAAERSLDVTKAEKKQVTHSMIGIRNTLLFYIWKDQKAALRVTIGNDNTKFPTKATVLLFPADTTAEGLDKWLNNQHSDGLFIDPAEPEKTIDLPDANATVTAHKLLNPAKKEHNGTFGEYEVTIEVTDPGKEDDGFLLQKFEDTAKVFVKQAAG